MLTVSVSLQNSCPAISGKASSLYCSSTCLSTTQRYLLYSWKDIVDTVQAQHLTSGNYTELLYSIFHTEISKPVKNKHCNSPTEESEGWEVKHFAECKSAAQQHLAQAFFQSRYRIFNPSSNLHWSSQGFNLFFFFIFLNFYILLNAAFTYIHEVRHVGQALFYIPCHGALRAHWLRALPTPHFSPLTLPGKVQVTAGSPLHSSAPTSTIHRAGVKE